MIRKTGLILGIGVLLILIGSYAVFSQEATPPQEPTVTEPAATSEPETQWIWGEVVSLDLQKNELVVKYLDYETDEEKEIAIAVDDKTTYENVKSLTEIVPKDTLSIDYIVSAEGKNIAKNISVEQPESEPETTSETAPETIPETAGPQQ